MANHKRRRPKHKRAGCLFCKGHKDERAPKSARVGGGGDKRRDEASRKELRDWR